MKKIIGIFLLMSLSAGLMAQGQPGAALSEGEPVQLEVIDVECMDNPAFSQVSTEYHNAYFADDGSDYLFVADDYLATQPFASLRFWGANFYGGIPGATESFIIKIYDGPPNAGGVEIYSDTKVLTPVLTGYTAPWGGNTPIYYVDVDFGTHITQLTGWIVVGRVNPDPATQFAWLSYDGGNGLFYQNSSGDWFTTGSSHFFCLGGDPPSVPIGKWALFVGLAMMVAFVVVRYRRAI